MRSCMLTQENTSSSMVMSAGTAVPKPRQRVSKNTSLERDAASVSPPYLWARVSGEGQRAFSTSLRVDSYRVTAALTPSSSPPGSQPPSR